ncbi:MAG: hypothetical protein LBU91_04350 [Bacteroidales bacterium]|nr:hypothetical protein [Bacteroidales bacterium]
MFRAGCRTLSASSETSPQVAGHFPHLRKPRHRLQGAFRTFGNLAAGCRALSALPETLPQS